MAATSQNQEAESGNFGVSRTTGVGESSEGRSPYAEDSEESSRASDEATESESDEYECMHPDCDRVFGSEHGRSTHMGQTHDMEILLQDELHRLKDKLGRTPRKNDMREHGEYSEKPYKRVFGTWNNALKEVGLEVNSRINIPDQDLLNELHRLKDELGRNPRCNDMREHGNYGSDIYVKTFGSWNNALKEVGLEVNSGINISDQDLLNELHRLKDELGRNPRCNDMNQYGNYSVDIYANTFGSWNDAIREVGMEPTQVFDGCSPDYGPHWKQTAADIRDRDDHQCRICDSSGLEDQALSIHHIKPRRHFLDEDEPDYEAMNDECNLIALCHSCHQSFEGQFQDADPEEFARRARESLESSQTMTPVADD